VSGNTCNIHRSAEFVNTLARNLRSSFTIGLLYYKTMRRDTHNILIVLDARNGVNIYDTGAKAETATTLPQRRPLK
jgi:hypothetical protein